MNRNHSESEKIKLKYNFSGLKNDSFTHYKTSCMTSIRTTKRVVISVHAY